jgi:DNA-directed RNA polymerase specialized sigma24 family protein
MPASELVTVWLGKLKAGDPGAADKLWEGYYRRLVGLARQRLRGLPRAAADEEDVALSAFDSFFRGAEEGRFPRLADRHDLWQLLVLITARKACRLIRHERRQKRGGGAVRQLSALADDEAIAEVIGREPTAEFALQVAEECRVRLDALSDPDLRTVALLKMEGRTNAEIAAGMGVVERTVERRLALLRKLWNDEEGVG